MPRSSGSSTANDGGSGRRRYAAKVEKGENAWKREWGSFISGVNLKRLRDGTSGVSLRASADIERQLEPSSSTAQGHSTVRVDSQAGKIAVNGDGIPLNAGAGSASFSYLFSSPAERRAERDARERAEKERRRGEMRERMAKSDPLSVMSKHQRAVYEAAQRGLQLEGMNRKARRDFLRLTVSEAQKKAEEQSRKFKLHDLMDEKLAWYQQGPHPVDLIAEKLVRRKAEKKAKQLGLKYNYLAPHASWLAKRAQRRRESLLVGLGKRLVFQESYDEKGNVNDDEGLTVTDPLRQCTVPLRDMGMLLASATVGPNADGAAANAVGVEKKETDEVAAEATMEFAVQSADGDDNSSKGAAEGNNKGDTLGAPLEREANVLPASTGHSGATHAYSPPLPDVDVLQHPSRLATSFVRSVVRDRATAVAIQQMNRTTTFLSSGLVKGPSLLPEDTASAKGLPVQMLTGGPPLVKPGSAAAATKQQQSRRPTRASAAPSFDPYALPTSIKSGEAEAVTPASSKPVEASRESRKRAQTPEGEEEIHSITTRRSAREKTVKKVKDSKKGQASVAKKASKQTPKEA